MAADRLAEEALGRLLIPLLREEKINGLTGLIRGAICVALPITEIGCYGHHRPTS